MSTQDPIEPSYEIYAHTVTEMKHLLLDIKSQKVDIDWKQKAEELESELKSLKKNKNYGLFWKEKQEEFDIKTKDALPVLREVPELTISQDESLSNIIIEGDNYHTLSVLSYTHKGQVDVIYIDPPYNTGNKDFIYNDRYVDREDDFRHSKWLSFMQKRLKLARDLLKDTGVIFISIDDNEQAQLRLLCDEIFDRDLFLGQLIWNKQHSQQQGIFKVYHEYILAYSRRNNQQNISGGDGEILAGALKKISKSNPESEFLFPAGTRVDCLGYKEFPDIIGDSEKVFVKNGKFIAENGVLKYDVVLSAGWTQKDQMIKWFKGEETIDSKGQKVLEFFFNSEGKLKCRKERSRITPPTILPEFGMVSEQTNALNEILGINSFGMPKPVEMIKLFIQWFTKKENSLILDFFAGSGTTGHAVLALNQEDGGNRRFILCSNRENTSEYPDKNICRDITYERVKRVATGYTNTKGEYIEGLGGNIRYLETDFIPKHKGTDNLRNRMVERCSEMLCLRENIWESVERLSDENMLFYERGDRYLAVLFGLFRFSEFSDKLRTLDKPVSIYVFSRGQMMHDDFEGITVPYTVEEIPDPILAVYKNIFGL